MARSRRKHAMHQLKVVVFGQKPLSRAVKEDRGALRVHYQYRLGKVVQFIDSDVYFATSGSELGAEFASALNPPQQGGQFVLIFRVESWLIERPQGDKASDLFGAAECDSNQTVKGVQWAQPVPIKFRSNKFPIGHQFGTRKCFSRHEATFNIEPHVLSGKAGAVERSESLIDTCGVADLALLRDEDMIDESNQQRIQIRTQPYHHLVPEVRITRSVVSEMKDLADCRIDVRHISLRSP